MPLEGLAGRINISLLSAGVSLLKFSVAGKDSTINKQIYDIIPKHHTSANKFVIIHVKCCKLMSTWCSRTWNVFVILVPCAGVSLASAHLTAVIGFSSSANRK